MPSDVKPAHTEPAGLRVRLKTSVNGAHNCVSTPFTVPCRPTRAVWPATTGHSRTGASANRATRSRLC